MSQPRDLVVAVKQPPEMCEKATGLGFFGNYGPLFWWMT